MVLLNLEISWQGELLEVILRSLFNGLSETMRCINIVDILEHAVDDDQEFEAQRYLLVTSFS